MIHTVDIVLPLEVSEDTEARRKAVGKMLAVRMERVKGMRLRKHSIDARQRQVKLPAPARGGGG